MAVLQRVTTFIPNTLIQSAQVNSEFNQLVNILSGVSTDKDALIKYSHAADPVLRVDQLGAGLIQQWLQNGAVKARVNNDGSFNIGTPGASPTNGLVAGPESSGTDIAGAHLDLHGGKGTGTGIPGHLAARYPLIGASGASLQSLSTERFPISSSLYTNTTNGTAIANTVAETSLFTGATASSGSTLTVQGGSARAGTMYHLKMVGGFNTTGTPTIRLRLKLGASTIGDSTAVTAANNSAGLYFLDVNIYINAIGASGSVRAEIEGKLIAAISGAVTPIFFVGAVGAVTVDLTANQAFDVTAQWGTASASNIIQLISASIDRVR